MANLINGGGQWVETDPALAGEGTGLTLRRRRANVYTLTAHVLGRKAGSIVPTAGGFAIVVGDFTGTGRAIRVGTTTTIR